MSHAQPPLVLLHIEDAIVALDIESALESAGYRVAHAAGDHDWQPCGTSRPLLAAIEHGEDWNAAATVFGRMRSQGVPCLLFTAEENDDRLPAELHGVERLVKPFDSNEFLLRIADMAARWR